MSKDINIKRTLLKAVKEIKSDLSKLSLKDIIVQFSHDVDEYDKVIREKEQKVIEEFTDVYLSYYEDKSLFGNELKVLHVKSLEVDTYTTEWKRTYMLTGSRIVFHKGGFYYRELDTSVYSSYTEEDLRNMTVITKEKFESYLNLYNQLSELVSQVLKD